VSVCGTVAMELKLRGFSWKHGICHFRLDKPALVNTPQLSHADLPAQHVYTLEPGRPTPGRHNLLRPPIAFHVGAGILTRFPSATTLVLTLGADSPCADNVAQETLGFRRAGLSPALSLLMSAFALPIPPANLPVHLHRPTERSPTAQIPRRIFTPLASAHGLSPVTSSAQDDSTSELLRFL